MKRKVLSVILTGAMVAGLAGTVTVHAEEQKTYNIGICQLVQHEALDAATQGFEDAVKEGLGEENVTFDEQNAQGDSATCSTIINNFVSSNVDLILANATASLQAAAAGTSDIPILGTAVTEYGVALDLTDLGYTCEYYAFSDSNDISSVVTNAVADSDVIYVPTDNTAASNTELINNICLPAKVPVIAGEEGICSGCGVATLSISYYDLGKATGEMAVKILKDGEDISTMPIEYAPNFTKEYNADICAELGIEVPDDYVAIGADAE